MTGQQNQEGHLTLSEVRYVKLVTVCSANPNSPLSDEGREQQVALLNRCLNDYPRGMILGTDTTIGQYRVGEHQLTMQRITYHIGFSRKPAWLQDEA